MCFHLFNQQGGEYLRETETKETERVQVGTRCSSAPTESLTVDGQVHKLSVLGVMAISINSSTNLEQIKLSISQDSSNFL